MSNPPQTIPSGIVYVCGLTTAKGYGLCHPLKNPSDSDRAGDTPIPRPLLIGSVGTRFSEVKGEYFLFAALEAAPNAGALWCWGSGGGGSSEGGGGKVFPPGKATLCIPGNVISFDVGQSFIVAIVEDDARVDHKRRRRLVTIFPRGEVVPFSPPLPAPSVCDDPIMVAASEDSVAVISGGDNKVFVCGKASSGLGGVDGQWAEIVLQRQGGDGLPLCSCTATGAVAGEEGQTSPRGLCCKASFVALGSLNGAAITQCGRVHVWGDGLSGSLGVGRRGAHSRRADPANRGHFIATYEHTFGSKVVHVSCTKAQSNPKRLQQPSSSIAYLPGQEGPRIHVVAEDGSLYIAGTTHKGLGANCLFKQLSPPSDLLSFYRVGGVAVDGSTEGPRMPTGAWEMLQRDGGPTAAQTHAMQMGMADIKYLGSDVDVRAQADKSKELPSSARGDEVKSKGAAVPVINTNYLSAVRVIKSFPAHIHSVALSSPRPIANGEENQALTALIAAKSMCFGWGCGSGGRLGLSCFFDRKGAKRLMKCYVSSPTAVDVTAKVPNTTTAASTTTSSAATPFPNIIDACPCRCSTLFIVGK